MLLLLFFFSVVFHCLLMYECLLFIVMCALDMLLIKATCLLNCSRYRSKRDEISAEEKDIFR